MNIRYFAIIFLLLATTAQARDPAQVRDFRRENPCPATNQASGPCEGYVVDHFVPLCAGGLDDPSNMSWQDVATAKKKDIIEIAYCRCMSRELKVCQ